VEVEDELGLGVEVGVLDVRVEEEDDEDGLLELLEAGGELPPLVG